jgi:hypothetical protein
MRDTVCGNGHEPWVIGWAGIPAAATVHVVNLDAVAFSQQWVQAWNAHDVEAVLRHIHEDVMFTSPVAAKLCPETAGVIRGKAELRRYWTVGEHADESDRRERITHLLTATDRPMPPT